MRYVALLRAVNVGGTGKLPMADLKKLVEAVGATNVSTYIASGNVLFDARGTAASVGKKIQDALRARLKLDTDVIVRTADELEPCVKDHAFKHRGADGSRLHIVFLSDAPTESAVGKIDRSRSPDDELEVRGREIHWHTPEGAGQSKFSIAYFERVLGVTGTTRNHNTVSKLYDLLRAG